MIGSGVGVGRLQRMKIACVGTDPAGLYLGVLLKKRDPSHIIRFVEAAEPIAVPSSIICNPLRPRLALAGTETLDAPEPAISAFDKVTIDADGRLFETKGLKYAAVDRWALVRALKQRASALGCEFVQGRGALRLDALSDFDLVVAADGPSSPTRTAAAGFQPNLARSSNRSVVFQSAEPLD